MSEWIRIRGARQHNLKNIDVALPKNKLVVITGPSGAGKSSLAFDTLYAEGQRRYVESLSPAARQFLNQLEKPDVDAVEGLSPAIAVEQRAGTPNPRSTVGTVSDVYDYLRLLYARVAQPRCYRCGIPIRGYTVQEIVDAALAVAKGGAPTGAVAPPPQPAASAAPAETRPSQAPPPVPTAPGQTRGEPAGPAAGGGAPAAALADPPKRLMVLAPVTVDPALDFADLLRRYQREGFGRVRLNGQILLLEEGVPEPQGAVSLALVVDRLALQGLDPQRLTEAVELALTHGAGQVHLLFQGAGEADERVFSRTPRCPRCGLTYPEPHPRLFSFNSPQGACPTCHGLGTELTVTAERVVPDAGKSLAEGAIAPWEKKNSLAFH
ncbi:MAG TPA: hypothetical protein VL359_03815, partial [bacterium]|nr:hypothetical protein [bacterium]